jgi:hypothetical protein
MMVFLRMVFFLSFHVNLKSNHPPFIIETSTMTKEITCLVRIYSIK